MAGIIAKTVFLRRLFGSKPEKKRFDTSRLYSLGGRCPNIQVYDSKIVVMSIWKRYKQHIKNNFCLDQIPPNGVAYWKTRLFANAIIYTLPLSLIAYVPGVYYSWYLGLYSLVLIDTLAVLLIFGIGFLPALSLQLRKALFVFCVYFIAVTFIWLIGTTGPGLLYMLAASYFCILIFPNQYAFYPAYINLIICLLTGLLIPLNIFPWKDSSTHNVSEWFAVCTNLIFLGFISSALIPRVFNSLDRSLRKEQDMRVERDRQNLILEKTLEDLKRKNQELEQFAFVASHDLQEPLRMITSFLGQIEKKYGDKLDDKGRQYIYFASDGAKRMRQIILDLLEYSRIDQARFKPEFVDLGLLVDEICILHSKTIEEKSAQIYHQDLPIIHHYRSPLLQVLQNLISNALKYSHPDRKPEITVSAVWKERLWVISVKDNGIGIEPVYFDKIFVLFERLHSKHEYGGTGMGLAIVKKVMDSLKERIWVESENGKGSVFHFTIEPVA